jgi:hypothetical protein
MAVGVDLVQVIFDRTAVSPDEDDAIITMHCRGVAAGLPDVLNPMDNTNRTNFAGKIDAWWTTMKTYVASDYVLKGIKFYSLPDAVGELLGPPDMALTRNVAGTGGNKTMPTQIATSVTFITDARKTWGRFYIPGIDGSNYSNHRLTSALCTTIANTTHLLTDRSATGACLTVWSRTHWTHHDPQFIQVDDVPDVIRSRRLTFATVRAKISAG